MYPLVSISFGKSRSKQYGTAVAIAQGIYGCEQIGDIYKIEINEIMVFLKYEHEILKLIDIIHSWKGAEVLFYGNKYRSAADYFAFMKHMTQNAGKYAPLVNSSHIDVAMHSVTMESLPLQFVHYPGLYGAFFSFSEDIDSQEYFCECERKPIENYVRLRKQKPLENYTGEKTYPLGGDLFPERIANESRRWTDSPINHIKFKEGLCFGCNKRVPKLSYCHAMYGDRFEQKYGWYRKQEMLRMGIDPLMVNGTNVLADECPPDIYDDLMRLNKMWNEAKARYPENVDQEETKLLYKEFERVITNKVRVKFGFKKVGESWISETMMFHIVEEIYSGKKTHRHYRPGWLEGLELDIYVPDEEIAFEYQGIQHFQPVEHWGGMAQLKKQQEHDAKKKRICEQLGVRLICINYDEELTYDHIMARINNT